MAAAQDHYDTADQIRDLMTIVCARERKLYKNIRKHLFDLRSLPTNEWSLGLSTACLLEINRYVTEWHNIACEIKVIEILLSGNSNLYEDVQGLLDNFALCLNGITEFDVVLKLYEKRGYRTSGEQELYLTSKNIYLPAKSMLENSFKGIFLLNGKLKQMDRPEVNRIGAPVANGSEAPETSPKAPTNVQRHYSNLSQEDSVAHENTTTTDTRPTEIDAGMENEQSGSGSVLLSEPVGEDIEADESAANLNEIKLECAALCGDLDLFKEAIVACKNDASLFIATAKTFGDIMTPIVLAGNSLLDRLGRSFDYFIKSKEWKQLEKKWDDVLKAFAAKGSESFVGRRRR